ncbi:transposase [Atopobium sp. oral taxon 416]|uniref:transposase n=1 Tax=Atopobium sp. oral taxon 416 TaxID=712157 RepID=UPI001BA62B94|nr:transposase [Atopobium sp. oral taxon 416]
MPQAAQILDSFHVVAALHKGDRPCEVHAEARVGEEAQGCLPRRTYAWLKRKKSLTECRLAKREELDPAKTHLRGARACQTAKRCRTSMAAPTENLQPKPQTGSVCG